MKKIILKSSALLTLVFTLSLTLFLLLPVNTSHAQLTFTPQVDIPGGVSGPTSVGTNGQSTLLGEYIVGIYDYSFAIAGILAAIVLMGGGVLWLVSGGNQTKVSKAKDIIGGSLIGLGILFSGYILFNTINPALLEMKPIELPSFVGSTSNENTINCCVCKINVINSVTYIGLSPDQYNKCEASVGFTRKQCDESCKQWANRVEAKQFLTKSDVIEYDFKPDHTCGSDEESYQCIPLSSSLQAGSFPTAFNSQGWSFDPGIDEQIGDMSPELAQFLNCMRTDVPLDMGKISSISDHKHIGELTECEDDSYNETDCVHVKNSCHYGGGYGTNESYAVDLGDEKNLNFFIQPALACDPGARIVDEDNHIHISISKCKRNN